jgi:hypothetical protein
MRIVLTVVIEIYTLLFTQVRECILVILRFFELFQSIEGPERKLNKQFEDTLKGATAQLSCLGFECRENG